MLTDVLPCPFPHTDPAIKWMELRKQGKIKERETYEQYDETNVRTYVRVVPSPPRLIGID